MTVKRIGLIMKAKNIERFRIMENQASLIVAMGMLAIVASTQAQDAVPENPGFTPEQAAAMEQQGRDRKWSQNALSRKELPPPSQTRAAIRIEGKSLGRRWGGIGSAPATAMERQLMHYPEPIQKEILDLMFTPNFGMALTHLKVEVGGDNNSTAAVEPSFAHTWEEMATPNFRRGGNYWLMRQARDRNSGIELGSLAWTQPYWVGNGAGRIDNQSFYTQESADYFVKFYEGARKEWGLEMQFFSAEQNERATAGRRDWVLNHLRPAFDKAGFEHIKFVIDSHGWPLRPEDEDPALMKHVYALGAHYVENNAKKIVPPGVQASGKPLWNAECWSRIGRTWPMAMYHAESTARCYVDSRITQFTTWPILGGGLPGSMMGPTGLMQANKPWSGYYEVYPTVWTTAHFNQFAPLGWNALEGGCGGLFVEANLAYDQAIGVPTGVKPKGWPRARLYYLTLQSPDKADYSIIVVNASPFARTLDFELQDLPAKPLHQWVSTEQEQFIHTGQVNPSDGKFTLQVEPWSVYSLTTTSGQQKGKPKNPIPSDTPLALPYSDDFESYFIGADARYQSCSAGYFEVYQAPGEGKTLRQMVPAKGLTWSIPKDNYPCVAIGDIRWGDYEVSSDALLEGKGTVALWARVNFFRDHGMAGYYLRVDQEGKWELGVAKNRHRGEMFYTEKSLANGVFSGFKPEAWHNLSLAAEGDLLRASIDGKPVAEVKDGTHTVGAVGYSTWAEGIQKDHEDMKKAMVIGTKYGQARYDNLNVRPLPGKKK
jgi:galactosylceramidase